MKTLLHNLHDRIGPVHFLHTRYAALEKWLIRRGAPYVLPLPDFLCIGATKAGTTWLYYNLEAHPDVYFPHSKEQHYFDRNYDLSLPFYSYRYWRGRRKTKGDVTPAYSILPMERIRFIRKIMPDVRLIYILRNPIERTWSEVLHNLLRKANKRRFEQVPESEIIATINSEPILVRSAYLTNLDNWQSVFPGDQVYVTFFERISTEPQQLLQDVMGHIGVSSDIDWATMPFNQKFNVNPAVEIPQTYLELLQERYCPMIETLYERFGAPVEAWRCNR